LKLVSFLRPGSAEPHPGALLSATNEVVDFLSEEAGIPAPDRYLDWFDIDGSALAEAQALTDALGSDSRRLESMRAVGAIVARGAVRLIAPVPRPGKVICIGLNYRDHAAESKMAIPERPLVFSKFPTSVCGPGDTVRIPRGCEQLDYEAELGVVVGKRARDVAVADGLEHVLGYVNLNDVSARDFQFADGQWQRGKSCDTFAPMGEYVATREEIADPHRLRIRLRLNGDTMQDSSTDQLIFRVPELIASLSEAFTLEPGDVIATGTPPGVGFARKPPVWLKAGDRVEVEIEGLGVLVNSIG